MYDFIEEYIYIYRERERDKTRIRMGIDNGWKIGGLKCEGSREVMKLYSVLAGLLASFIEGCRVCLIAVHLWGILAEDVD